MNPTPISITDAENIYKAIHTLFLNYKNYPFKNSNENIKWNTIPTHESIGLFLMGGGVYLSRYASGGYRAQQPIRVVYRSSPTTNKGQIDAAELLNELIEWVSECSVKLEDNTITIDSIEKTSLVYTSDMTEQYTDYAVNISVKYTKLKGE